MQDRMMLRGSKLPCLVALVALVVAVSTSAPAVKAAPIVIDDFYSASPMGFDFAQHAFGAFSGSLFDSTYMGLIPDRPFDWRHTDVAYGPSGRGGLGFASMFAGMGQMSFGSTNMLTTATLTYQSLNGISLGVNDALQVEFLGFPSGNGAVDHSVDLLVTVWDATSTSWSSVTGVLAGQDSVLIDLSGSGLNLDALTQIEFQFQSLRPDTDISLSRIVAVPEPSSVAMLTGLGLAGMGIGLWRRRKKAEAAAPSDS